MKYSPAIPRSGAKLQWYRFAQATRDTRLSMDQLQTVARHPPVIMMQSLESGAPDPKAQSSNTSLATPSEGSALGFRWLLVPLVLGLIAIWPLSSLRGTSEETAITLPDGVALDLPKDSCAYELGHFLANPSDPYAPRVLVIDRLTLTGSDTSGISGHSTKFAGESTECA